MAIPSIYAQARKTPDKTAVVHNGAGLSYAHFARWIEGCRRHLAAQSLPAGSIAAICAGNLLEAWVLLLALRAVGLSTIVVNSAEHVRGLALRNLGVVVTFATGAPPDVDRVAADVRSESADGRAPRKP